jgi:hypothetical protein
VGRWSHRTIDSIKMSIKSLSWCLSYSGNLSMVKLWFVSTFDLRSRI